MAPKSSRFRKAARRLRDLSELFEHAARVLDRAAAPDAAPFYPSGPPFVVADCECPACVATRGKPS